MSERETVNDIIAEMRGIRVREFQDYADRLEAANRREADYAREAYESALKAEREALREQYEAGALVDGTRGDSAKLREAVGYILKYADSVACRDHDEHTRHYIDQMRKWAQSALAAPPRNCDVGTAEEQSERMDAAYCSKRLCAKGKCPLFKPGLDCSLIWAQMPYEEGGAK